MSDDKKPVIAIIPARGGSKRIPGKNIKLFAGKPMIAHSIIAAKESNIFDRIVVTTDSEDIARVAIEYEAEVPFRRPERLADDHTNTDDVLLHTLDWLKDQGAKVDFACCIYATAPFVSPEFIRKGYDLLRDQNATTAFSVTSFGYPIFRSLRINSIGRLEMFWPEHRLARSQDLPEAYHDAGQFYWFSVSRYVVEKKLFSSDSLPVVIPRYLVQDIDTPEDWATAERMHYALQHY